MLANQNLSQFPRSENYIARTHISIAEELFGEEAFEGGILLEPLCVLAGHLAQRSWDRLRRKHLADMKNFDELQKQAKSSFEALTSTSKTREVAKVIHAVSKWKELVKIYGTEENCKMAEDMMLELERILDAFGVKVRSHRVKNQVNRTQLSTLKKGQVSYIASQEDIEYLMTLYETYFGEDDDSGGDPLLLPAQLDVLSLAGKGDLGVGTEASMNIETLVRRLGYRKDELPHQFNVHLHQQGLNKWDNPDAFGDIATLMPFKLHWHQMVGIHAAFRGVLSETADASVSTGMLIADDVGLGKTALMMGFIATLNQAIIIQEKKEELPPFLKEKPFLKGKKVIPSAPHLLVVPGTLQDQVIKEVKRTFRPGSVDIFVYRSSRTGNPEFWGEGSDFRKSKQSPQNVLIITTHSSLCNEFTSAFRTKADKTQRPWELPKQFVRSLDKTIFGQEFLTVTVDEMHLFRNLGARYYSVLALMQKAYVKLGLTGTPLHTSPKASDILSLGRLLDIPYFVSEASFADSKDYERSIRQAKKLDDDGKSVAKLMKAYVKKMHDQFQGHIIRRTSQSVKWNGQKLLDLPPLKQYMCYLDLTEREKSILHSKAKEARSNASTANELAVWHTKSFYLEYRMLIAYAKDNREDPLPSPKSLKEWNPIRSTKMTVCAMLCRHYLKQDDVGDPQFKNGQPEFPIPPKLKPGETPKRTRKILIYSEFPSLTKLLLLVLKLYGVKALSIDGKDDYDVRSATVEKFKKGGEDDPRVLVFSVIGSEGLNLTEANIVILFDQAWSSQTEAQVIARALRQPQSKPVKAFHLLANDSTDILMTKVAEGKETMAGIFTNTKVDENKRLNKDMQEAEDVIRGGIGHFPKELQSDDESQQTSNPTDDEAQTKAEASQADNASKQTKAPKKLATVKHPDIQLLASQVVDNDKAKRKNAAQPSADLDPPTKKKKEKAERVDNVKERKEKADRSEPAAPGDEKARKKKRKEREARSADTDTNMKEKADRSEPAAPGGKKAKKKQKEMEARSATDTDTNMKEKADRSEPAAPGGKKAKKKKQKEMEARSASDIDTNMKEKVDHSEPAAPGGKKAKKRKQKEMEARSASDTDTNMKEKADRSEPAALGGKKAKKKKQKEMEARSSTDTDTDTRHANPGGDNVKAKKGKNKAEPSAPVEKEDDSTMSNPYFDESSQDVEMADITPETSTSPVRTSRNDGLDDDLDQLMYGTNSPRLPPSLSLSSSSATLDLDLAMYGDEPHQRPATPTTDKDLEELTTPLSNMKMDANKRRRTGSLSSNEDEDIKGKDSRQRRRIGNEGDDSSDDSSDDGRLVPSGRPAKKGPSYASSSAVPGNPTGNRPVYRLPTRAIGSIASAPSGSLSPPLDRFRIRPNQSKGSRKNR
ncbi:hypothetical protein D9758_018091 [Tetrapyrgos nigripes]|uniref:Helicase C-terminal domain-containing protein n=1 Tax=Tetrapyrgos nigripes TaxID=182062 RepID=A0A8H5BZ99_9AGAR|nr:hypothetical protein D9758_018091 [Tetrapyrgos nigripes]